MGVLINCLPGKLGGSIFGVCINLPINEFGRPVNLEISLFHETVTRTHCRSGEWTPHPVPHLFSGSLTINLSKMGSQVWFSHVLSTSDKYIPAVTDGRPCHIHSLDGTKNHPTPCDSWYFVSHLLPSSEPTGLDTSDTSHLSFPDHLLLHVLQLAPPPA